MIVHGLDDAPNSQQTSIDGLQTQLQRRHRYLEDSTEPNPTAATGSTRMRAKAGSNRIVMSHSMGW
jgi:hypothetical protein